MDNWREYLNGADVRSTPLRDQLYNDTMPLQTDWTKFPGMPSLWYGEHWVLNNTYTLIHTTNRYWHWSIYISIGYVITIFALQSAMAKLNVKLELKRQLIAWNLFLAIFSFLGTIRCWPEFIHVITTRGFTASYTEADYALDTRLNAWYLFFTLSKAPELVDTLFIVLRQRRLINLHWIHHTLTLVYSWFAFPDVPSTARWMVNMNVFIHTLMYSYYALAAMKVRIPRQVNVVLTTMQIAQMFVGLYINADCLRRKLSGIPTDLSLSVALSGFSLYFLFFLLFVNFFVKTYLVPASSTVVKVAVMNGKTILSDLNNNAGRDQCSQVVKKLQ